MEVTSAHYGLTLGLILLVVGIAPALAGITVPSDDFDSLNLPDGTSGNDFVGFVPNWTSIGFAGGARGNNNLGPLVGAFLQFPDLADTSATGGIVGCMDGPNSVFNFAIGAGNGISRDVGTVDANQTYTVTLCMLGDRDNGQLYAGYTIELRSGPVVLSSLSSDILPPSFSDVSFSWDSSTLPGGVNVGDPLTVRILSKNGTPGQYLDFDNFRISSVASVTEVEIDIKPGSDPNSINLGSGGTVAVAVLGSASLNVNDIDPDTLTLGTAGVKTVGKTARTLCSVADVSGDFSAGPEGAPDGFPDLVCHFITMDIAPEAGDTTATISGNLLAAAGGAAIEGTDSVNIIPPE
jgi:hypothetical protein